MNYHQYILEIMSIYVNVIEDWSDDLTIRRSYQLVSMFGPPVNFVI